MRTTFILNGKQVEVETDADATLLWTLRDNLEMTGTKYGCGISMCGACTVHLDGDAVRSCMIPMSLVQGKKVTTIEGLSEDNSHPLQKAWIEAQAPQCGYCHSGQIMQAAAMLNKNPKPDSETIKSQMNGVLCRCGAYMRIHKAILKASNQS